MAKNKGRARLDIQLSDADDEKIDLACRTTGGTRTQVVRAALTVYFKACVEVARGGQVLIKQSDGHVVELLLPTG